MYAGGRAEKAEVQKVYPCCYGGTPERSAIGESIVCMRKSTAAQTAVSRTGSGAGILKTGGGMTRRERARQHSFTIRRRSSRCLCRRAGLQIILRICMAVQVRWHPSNSGFQALSRSLSNACSRSS